MTRRAVFIDRDGVINALSPDPDTGLFESPLAVHQVSILPGANEAIQLLNQNEWLAVCVTNQPAAAKGKSTVSALESVHERVLKLLREAGAEINHSEICLHHPDGIVDELRRDCACRKPAPGMLLAAADRLQISLSESWMVGDSDSDIEAGWRAGCKTVLVEHGPSAHRRAGSRAADFVVPSLLVAVQVVLSGKLEC